MAQSEWGWCCGLPCFVCTNSFRFSNTHNSWWAPMCLGLPNVEVEQVGASWGTSSVQSLLADLHEMLQTSAIHFGSHPFSCICLAICFTSIVIAFGPLFLLITCRFPKQNPGTCSWCLGLPYQDVIPKKCFCLLCANAPLLQFLCPNGGISPTTTANANVPKWFWCPSSQHGLSCQHDLPHQCGLSCNNELHCYGTGVQL